MGIYLNPGNENFTQTLAADIYVDKTMMIDVINSFIEKGNKYVCVSRPRRFGKTVTGNMLAAYYSKGCASHELFEPLKISHAEGYEENLNRYNVIHIDLNSEYQNALNKGRMIAKMTDRIRNEMRREFPEIVLHDDDSLAECILTIYSATGETFILLIDEYDVLVREQVDEELFFEYMSFLNGLFKSNTLRPAISLAYMTGILPVIRDKIQSKLNNFREYSILNAMELSEFVGFTDEEVRALCDRYGIDYEDCRRWYDGYQMNEFEIYNPESVVMCIHARRFGSYWGQTSSYEVISDKVRMNFEGTKDSVIQMLAGESVPVDIFSFLNTMTDFTCRDDIFGYLLHLGYLTYDPNERTCRIPNREVREEWIRSLRKMPQEYSMTNRIIESSRELLEATWAGDEEAVAKALDASHIHVTSNRSYNNEDALQSAIYLAFIYALNRYTCVREMTAGKGFADVVYIPVHEEDPAMIIELKRNGSAGQALGQIEERQYPAGLEHYAGELLLIGIDYDEKEKTHTCRIRRARKDA